MRHLTSLCAALWLLIPLPGLADLPVLRVAVQVAGTVNWELSTITENGFDTAEGFALQVQDVAGTPSALIALQGGTADVIVTDWLWVARQRADGQDYVFIPYSKAVGALLVPADSQARTLSDLQGGTIGIAGGPTDKSWLILRAYAEQTEGVDLAATTEQVFGAPPLISQAALSGEVSAAITFWNYVMRLQVAGMRPLITVAEASTALGLDPETPLLGYVLKGSTLRDHPDLVAGLQRASRAAKNLLATDDAAWESLRPRINAASEAEFAALRAGFRAGIPAAKPVDTASAARLLDLMVRLGGTDLMGNVTTMPDGIFVPPAP